MNYLAHLFLGDGEPLFLAGAVAGDVLRGPVDPALPAPLQAGIRLHRAIDAFADAHPALGRSRRRLPSFRHHARIIVDVFYDHYLARSFERLAGEPLESFTSRTYQKLATAHDALPHRVNVVLQRMASHDWLTSYQEAENIRRALHSISGRLRQRVELGPSVDTMLAEDAAFESDFEGFFPEVRLFAAARRRELSAS